MKPKPDEVRKLSLPTNPSPSFVRRNPHLYAAAPTPSADAERAMETNRRLEIRPTTDEAKLNKLETDYLAWLRTLNTKWIGVQCITLKIGHDCRFTADFWALDENGLRAIDTKGFAREDSRIKIKCAARMYPWISFVIATRNGKVWKHEQIRP